MLSTIFVFLIALISCLVLVPLAKRLAVACNIIDSPDKQRKLHVKSIPLAGGMAILVTFLFTSAVSLLGSAAAVLPYELFGDLLSNQRAFIGLLLASIILFTVGIIDDRFGLRGRQKLLGQILAVLILLGVGFRFEEFDLFGMGKGNIGYIEGSHICLLIGFIWLLGTINAVNLIDGADGFASTVGIVACASLVIMSIGTHPLEAMLATALLGALVGFLFYNRPPASVFLGDSGSMLVGLLIGALSIRCSLKEATTLTLAAPIALLAIPFFDSFVAIVRRWLTGRSIYTTDRGHIHHVLQDRGLSPHRMLIGIAGLSVIAAAGGIISVTWERGQLIAPASVLLVIGVLVLGRIFGFAEFAMLSKRFAVIGKSFLVIPKNNASLIHQQTAQLQGSRDWGPLWEEITEFADSKGFAKVCLDLNLPWLHEGYHARWERRVERDCGEKRTLVECPLLVGGRVFGRLTTEIPPAKVASSQDLMMLAELVEAIEEQMAYKLETETMTATPQLPADSPERPPQPLSPQTELQPAVATESTEVVQSTTAQ